MSPQIETCNRKVAAQTVEELPQCWQAQTNQLTTSRKLLLPRPLEPSSTNKIPAGTRDDQTLADLKPGKASCLTKLI